MNKLLSLVAGFFGAVALIVFSTQPTQAQVKNTKFTIAVIPKGATHHCWKSIQAGALQAARELGQGAIVWKSGLKE